MLQFIPYKWKLFLAMANRPLPIFQNLYSYIISASTKTQENELLDLSVQTQDFDLSIRLHD